MGACVRRRLSAASPQAPSPARPGSSESLFPWHPSPCCTLSSRSSKSQNGLFPVFMAQGGGPSGRPSGRRKWVCNYSLVLSFIFFFSFSSAGKEVGKAFVPAPLSLLLGQVTQALFPLVLCDPSPPGGAFWWGATEGLGFRTQPPHVALGFVGAWSFLTPSNPSCPQAGSGAPRWGTKDPQE